MPSRACRALLLLATLLALPGALHAADLQPATVAAFDRYARLTEARIAGDVAHEQTFLRVDTLEGEPRRQALADLRAGQVVIERLRTLDRGQRIDVPDGLIHHWVGTIFIPSVTVDQAVRLMQDYDRHATLFAPAVVRSRLLSRNGDHFTLFLRFHLKRVLSVTVDTEHEAQFVRPDARHAYSALHSTRIAEVEDAGTASERERPVGHDSGFLWRFNTYWRFVERDGGTWVQCESISLSRGIPFGFGWLIGPFVNSIPRESLEFTLSRLREVLSGGNVAGKG